MGKSRNRKLGQVVKDLFTYDTSLIVAVLFLAFFGLVMIYSASYYKSSMSADFGNDQLGSRCASLGSVVTLCECGPCGQTHAQEHDTQESM